VEKFLTPEEVTEILAVPVETLRVWLRQGKIRGVKVGQLWRIPQEAVEEFTRPKKEGDFSVYTTWNRVAKAAANLDGYHFMVLLADDIPARLVPLVTEQGTKVPGWLEVEIQDHTGNYGPCFYDGTGKATTMADWILHLPAHADKEGVAIHEDVLYYLDKKGGSRKSEKAAE
jgi:acetyl-CoA synthetase